MIRSRNPDGPVLLVCKDIEYAFPFGVAYLAGYLREHGEDVRILFRPENTGHYHEFAEEILKLSPLVVGFGSLYPDLYAIRNIVGILDSLKRPFPIAVGGQMVSPIPDFSVTITGADLGVVGEGEITLHELVKSLRRGGDPSLVPGLAIRDGGKVYLTGPGSYIENLSLLPGIPYDLFPTEKWLPVGRFYTRAPQPHWRFHDKIISIHGGRGCPFSCNFCYHSNKPRYRKLPEMMSEAGEMLERFDANMLYFGDDLVIPTPVRAKELANAVGKIGRNVEYSVSCHFDVLDRIDDSILREMKRSGCRIMGLGVESGSQRILDVIGKRVRVEQIRNGLRRLMEAGILPTVSIMVGQESETAEDANKSMALMLDAVRQNRHIQFAFTITTPFPGSKLYRTALQSGLLADDQDFYDRFDPFRQMGEMSVNLSAMSDSEVRAFRHALERAYEREKRVLNGSGVAFIEFVRKTLGVMDYLVWQKHLDVGNRNKNGFRKALHRPYTVLYDSAQALLDRFRMRLLGIRST